MILTEDEVSRKPIDVMQKPFYAASASFLASFRTPVFAPLLEQRVLARAICGVAALILAMSAIGVSAWHCPVRGVLGVSCPGCGLTRALELLLRGHFRESLAMHAYAPLLLLGLVLLLLAALLPRRYSQHLTEAVALFEKRTFLGAIALTLLPIYWLIRLIFHASPP